MKFSSAQRHHVDQIRQLALRYHVLGQKNEDDGFTVAVYRPDVILSVLDEPLSIVLLDETDRVSGHFLACSQTGFVRAFGRTMRDDFSEYGEIDITNSSGYGIQVCLDGRFHGTGIYRQFHDTALEVIKTGGIDNVFVEISDRNKKSLHVHERFGWNRLASKSSDDVLDFKGNDAELIEATYGKMETRPCVLYLYHKRL